MSQTQNNNYEQLVSCLSDGEKGVLQQNFEKAQQMLQQANNMN
jgi:hypothetical protein